MNHSPKTTVQYRNIMELLHDVVQRIVRVYEPEKIILFGSYANGIPTLNSDIDLLIILDTDRPTLDVAVEISLLFPHAFPMDILVRTPAEIHRRLKRLV